MHCWSLVSSVVGISQMTLALRSMQARRHVAYSITTSTCIHVKNAQNVGKDVNLQNSYANVKQNLERASTPTHYRLMCAHM